MHLSIQINLDNDATQSPVHVAHILAGVAQAVANYPVDPVFRLENGASFEDYAKAANARAVFVARLLFEDGFTVFSAVKPISGCHIIRNVGQVCILHKEGARDATIAS